MTTTTPDLGAGSAPAASPQAGLRARAADLFPGGVNSPVRACKSVGCTPRFIERGDGCRIFDVDGNGDTIPFSEISWTVAAPGSPQPNVISAGTFNGGTIISTFSIVEAFKLGTPAASLYFFHETG